ncbi:hypothetical protein [Pseudomonas aeruginosa]|nr:hypothetical protein [Pseudomonas aeruginosa]QGK90142.1 hypothetical protein [Pseudomonas phage vB_PA32_GUMS]UNI71718.1 hypothetical protein Churi01_gp210 [Pseudomonas phage Churi01]UXD83124.1 hypothetical protein NP274_00072 [Pseudomonas phage Koomba boorn-mokiny kep-wari Wadjak 1]WNV50128.1 hypothetical protein [Pseudomonas phage PhiPizzaParty]WPJ69268.1 hypothetical protein PAZH1_145 [Pseudomonas phage PA_ZH1]
MTNEEIIADESKWADDSEAVGCEPVDLFIDFYWVEPAHHTQEGKEDN